jgi:hypothetical protein
MRGAASDQPYLSAQAWTKAGERLSKDGIRLIAVDGRRKHLVFQRHHRFVQAGCPGGGFAMADVGLNAADAAHAAALLRLQQSKDGGDLDLVANGCAGAMAFDETDGGNRIAGAFVGFR